MIYHLPNGRFIALYKVEKFLLKIIMRNKKGKIIKVILGKNINCSTVWAALGVLFYSVPISLVASLVSAYLLRRQFKKSMTLEDEIIKRKERAKKLKLEIGIILVTTLAIIVWVTILYVVTSSDFSENLSSIFLKNLSSILSDGWPFFVPPITGLVFSILIGRRILYSRLVYFVMPFIVLATIIIGGIVVVMVYHDIMQLFRRLL